MTSSYQLKIDTRAMQQLREKSGSCSVVGCGRKTIAHRLCTMHYQREKKHGVTGGPSPLIITSAAGAPYAWLLSQITQDTNACIYWPFASSAGYGHLRINRKQVKACREVCRITYGDPPSAAHHAAHKCGNTKCVNAKHLYWATPKQNGSDKILQGTSPRGARNCKVKLTESDVLTIRTMTGSARLIAAVYGVHKNTVSKIKRGDLWGWFAAGDRQ